jgi:hypothetical protein
MHSAAAAAAAAIGAATKGSQQLLLLLRLPLLLKVGSKGGTAGPGEVGMAAAAALYGPAAAGVE